MICSRATAHEGSDIRKIWLASTALAWAPRLRHPDLHR